MKFLFFILVSYFISFLEIFIFFCLYKFFKGIFSFFILYKVKDRQVILSGFRIPFFIALGGFVTPFIQFLFIVGDYLSDHLASKPSTSGTSDLERGPESIILNPSILNSDISSPVVVDKSLTEIPIAVVRPRVISPGLSVPDLPEPNLPVSNMLDVNLPVPEVYYYSTSYWVLCALVISGILIGIFFMVFIWFITRKRNK